MGTGNGSDLYSELVMLKVFLLMALKKIKQFAALHRYLAAHPGAALGLRPAPDAGRVDAA